MITISPAGAYTPTANILACLATFTEPMTDSHSENVENIKYTIGTPVLNKETVFIPITASITILSSTGVTKHIEPFFVAFQEQTSIPTQVTVTPVGRISHSDSSKHHIYESLEIIIA